ncbi:MAG: tRNA (adenosine(37)-N6)-dimethylallyltransferase MiaA [Myxococcota bacterium]|nr:tRNA (adenosine(37)-N6)-dimethylallyltransferase MiaA [Myxococcota bacterium]
MATQASRVPVVVVTGPTASGKTRIGIEIARRFGGEIVNADSMQVYRYMDIGTAKPTLEERASVRHHLFDIVDPDAAYSAGRYGVDAREAADEIHGRGGLVVLVGGSGLYIRAFLQGLVSDGGADPVFREGLEMEHRRAVASGDPKLLYRRLQESDPGTADRIHPNDLRRTIRALEICEQAGRPASGVRSDHGFGDRPYRSLHLAIDPGRESLDERIDQRCEEMIEAGLLREVRHLREAGYGPDLRTMQAIGYRHINPVADGSDTLANALVAMQRETRGFAGRQRTWIRKVEEAVWLDPANEAQILEDVEGFLESG